MKWIPEADETSFSVRAATADGLSGAATLVVGTEAHIRTATGSVPTD